MKIILLLALFIVNAQPIKAQFAGGSGTEEDPFQISTVDQLQEIRNHTDKHFIQINDIDASETENWNDGKGFNPIGDDVVRFRGSYIGGPLAVGGVRGRRLRPGHRGAGGTRDRRTGEPDGPARRARARAVVVRTGADTRRLGPPPSAWTSSAGPDVTRRLGRGDRTRVACSPPPVWSECTSGDRP